MTDSTLPKQSFSDFYVVSADSHVNEPNDLWVTQVDRQYRERVPRIEIKDGQKWFVMEGRRPSKIREAPRDEQVSVDEFKTLSEQQGSRPQLDRTKGAMFQQQGGIGADRWRDMAFDGIDAEVVFPNKGLANWSSSDPAHNAEMCRVYNVWASQAFAGDVRSYPVGCIPALDVGMALTEIDRVAKMGLHAVMMPPLANKGYNSEDYDPVWAALSEAGLPVCFHAGSGKDPRTASGNGGAIINYVVHAMNTVLEPVVQLCSSGVFERFPKLQFATIEAGAGWVPYALWAMDQGYDKHAFWVSPRLKERPSEYFRRHGHASFQDDPIGLEGKKWMGIDSILWGNDYPHLEGTWPYSSEVFDSYSTLLTRDEKAKVLGLNAARLFNIPVPEQYRAQTNVRADASSATVREG